MSITPDVVAKVAKLARLELDQDKTGQYATQLNDILAYMDKLAELDTSEVEPMYTPVDQVSVMRDDEVRKDYSREDILKNAPETDGAFFIVPRIV